MSTPEAPKNPITSSLQYANAYKKAASVLSTFPAVTADGIFSLAVTDMEKPTWFGKIVQYTLAVYKATPTPADPEYVHLLYVMYDMNNLGDTKVGTWRYCPKSQTERAALIEMMQALYEDSQ